MASPGSEIAFTLLLTNPGPAELVDVRVEDFLPPSLLLEDVDVYSGWVEITDNRATIILDRVAGGLTVVITVKVRVVEDAALGSVVEHQPLVSYAGMKQYWPPLSVALPPAELPPTGGTRSRP